LEHLFRQKRARRDCARKKVVLGSGGSSFFERGRIVRAVIDLHAHILPGLDDGARSIEESRALARRATRDGIDAIAATPHVRSDYPTTAEQMERGVAELRRDFAEQGIPLSVLHGGEIDLEQLEGLPDEELIRFTLAQTGRFLLIEFPYRGWPLALEQTVFRLRLRGFHVLLAHPERNAEVQERPDRLQAAVGAGALVQITAASIDGRLGRSPRAAAKRLLELRLAHVLASDAHTPEIREAGLARAAQALGDEAIARYLTEEVPAAIVAGKDAPPPPRLKRMRFSF
jgi:protein-tyrosine phosphatase